MSARRRSAPGRCSVLSALAGEPLAGSAADAQGWVALEQPGAWGAKALKDSALDPAIGKALDSAASKHGLRPVLIRRPGRAGGSAPDTAARDGPGRALPSGAVLAAGRVRRRPGRRPGPRLGRRRRR